MSHNQFLDLTQAVILISFGSRIQQLRSYSPVPGQWWLGFEFYPGGFWLLGVGQNGEVGWIRQKPPGVTPRPHPVSLYLKAHVVGHKILKVSEDSSHQVGFEISGQDATDPTGCSLKVKNPRIVVIEVRVPGLKPFAQTLKLAVLPQQMELASTENQETQIPAQDIENESPASKLLKVVSQDRDTAQEWLNFYKPLFDWLEANPESGNNDPKNVPLFLQPLVARAFAEGLLCDGDMLFRVRRRQERKLEKTQERLEQLKNGRGVFARSLKKEAREVDPKSDFPTGRPRKKPGIWVELKAGLWARLGRSATENDELFRQASDRDLWFHVRGQSGAHVWIPRGQSGLSPKQEAPEDVILLGARLALQNSKLASSGVGTVDWTERRSLRKLKGAIGKLEILRSKTRTVRLD